MRPKVILLTGFGINSEEETAVCFQWAGADTEIVHINDLIDGSKNLNNYQIMVLPGGFSYADDTGSGNAVANKLKNNLKDQVLEFARSDKLVIGICNGFQMLANLGLAPALDGKYGERQVALMHNNTARLQCRWVNLKVHSQKCIWTRDIDTIRMPISHGEGNFYTDAETLAAMQANDQIALRYILPDGSPANGHFPENPNGALDDIAGICDPSGRIFGLMPHPERNNSFTNEETWPLEKEKLIRNGQALPEKGAGLKIFENGVKYFT